MKITNISELNKKAVDVRIGIIEAIYSAQSGHPGGALSIADILTALYFNEMNIDPKNPKMENRDRLVLSKGHACAALYSVLANRGFFDIDILKSFRNINSNLQGHPDRNKIAGIDMTTGSLGQGLSSANGMAISAKRNKKDYRVYCIVGDGEIQEGQIWEAAMTSSHYKLDNLCLIIDNNNLQIDGEVKNVMNVYPIDEKLKAFGFEVVCVDGHNISELLEAFGYAKNIKIRPTAIIAKTIKGKGVKFMENQAKWHGKAPNEEEYKQAINMLKGMK